MNNLMEVTKMTRLTIICISFIIVNLMFAGQSYAKVDSEAVLGIWLFDEGIGDITEDYSENGNDGFGFRNERLRWVDFLPGSPFCQSFRIRKL